MAAREPKVGETVLWYRNADRSSHPYPARVWRVAGQGLVTLFVDTERGTRVVYGAPWLNDPAVQYRPRDELRIVGAWDFCEPAPTVKEDKHRKEKETT